MRDRRLSNIRQPRPSTQGTWRVCHLVLVTGVLLLLLSTRPAVASQSLHFYTGVLGLTPSASSADIRKSFRKLSLKLHPDKNPGDESKHQEFIRVAEAYEWLVQHHNTATAEDRTLLQHASDGLDAIARFQRQFDRSASVPGLSGRGRQGRAKDTENHAALSLEQFTRGDELHFSRKKRVICPACGGKGGHAAMSKCPNCGGSGLHMVATAGGGMSITGCGVCAGAGVLGQCSSCGGKGTIEVEKQYHITVQPGDPIGRKVMFIGDGDESPTTQYPGNYVVELKEARHGTYTRDGNDVSFIARIPADMPPPIHLTVTGLTGEPLKLIHPGPVSNGDVLTMTEQGMGYRDADGAFKRGNLKVLFYLK